MPAQHGIRRSPDTPLDGAPPRWLRNAWQSDVARPLASRDTTAELIRVLHYPKFRLIRDEREDLLADYLQWCEKVRVASPVEVPDCRDPSDRPFPG